MTTLQQLIDALTQALDNNPPSTPVVLTADDFDGEGDFLALDFLLSEMPDGTTHDYETRTVKGEDLNDTHVLVGDSGGLCAVYEKGKHSLLDGLMTVETEHGFLLIDPESDFEVIA